MHFMQLHAQIEALSIRGTDHVDSADNVTSDLKMNGDIPRFQH